VFDFASPDTHSPQRYITTVPQQALFLMNSPFIVQQAKKLLDRPEVAEQKTAAAKVEAMYRQAYGRSPLPDELTMALRFLKSADPPAATVAARRRSGNMGSAGSIQPPTAQPVFRRSRSSRTAAGRAVTPFLTR